MPGSRATTRTMRVSRASGNRADALSRNRRMPASNPREDLSDDTVAAGTVEAERLRCGRAGWLHQQPPQCCPPARQARLDHVLRHSETLRGLGRAQTFNL